MQKFATSAAVAAHFDIPAGSIRLIAADRADATVEVRPANPSKSRDVKAAEETTVDYADGVLRITAPAPRNQVFGSTGAVEVTVQLPAGSHVEGKTATAEFRGVGRLGDVTYDSAHGSVKLDETAGARIGLQAGDIQVGLLGGAARITTAKGDLTVAEAVAGEVVLRTEAGDITVGAARGTSATLDAGTAYGRISNTLQNAAGSGAALNIHATTSYGNIAARSN
ncbi:DUF4097 domain-containing protein [Streptomyces sp. NBC_00237]|uniref:DUF4097 family beta strand repeat-containing protein n=1 Tax=Streptomyces sp. NBC_00237 TaxID=2975687 RepID=UPI00224CDB0E|nr:DUF4097 family beta strand repeat-containing protein [Streptomyces sp. NBC_00237]MCX5201374.1 DUF4097 domain-containing protein [Streptomyces sp. NBC_00237]